MAYFQIAIDGPAGSGKSTVARAVAARLGFVYLSTGRFYRAFAHIMRETGMGTDEFLRRAAEYAIVVDGDAVSINGKDVSALVVREETGKAASVIAADPAIRKLAVRMQREYARSNSVVMDGRDIATVVLPNAQVKIFLTASPQVRAKRRAAELGLSEKDVPALAEEIALRDERDATRAADPLVKAPDATLVDTSDITVQEVVDKILSLYAQARKATA